jgi:hypothetical protein
MRYIDQHGNALDSVDLTKGYLVDKEFVVHPAKEQKGHYVYTRNMSGGIVQTYVIDEPAQSEYKEVTVQMFIPFDTDNAENESNPHSDERIKAIEDQLASYETAYSEGVNEA